MVGKTDDLMVQKALKAIAEEELDSFIDSEHISDDDLKKALLTAVDINILYDDYSHQSHNNSFHKKKLIKEEA